MCGLRDFMMGETGGEKHVYRKHVARASFVEYGV